MASHTFAVSNGRVVASAMVAATAPDAKSSRKLFWSASSGCDSVMPRAAGLPRRRSGSAEHRCRYSAATDPGGDPARRRVRKRRCRSLGRGSTTPCADAAAAVSLLRVMLG